AAARNAQVGPDDVHATGETTGAGGGDCEVAGDIVGAGIQRPGAAIVNVGAKGADAGQEADGSEVGEHPGHIQPACRHRNGPGVVGAAGKSADAAAERHGATVIDGAGN